MTLGDSLKQTAQRYEFKSYGGILNRLLLLLSLLTYTFNITVFLTGLWLLRNHYTNLFAMLGGVVLLGASWIVRPRFDKCPPLTLSRTEHSELYSLVNDICTTMDAPKFHTIAINNEYNAYCGRYGIFQKRVLGIGLPLLHSLTPQEFVALIGHEAAHGKNRDPLRGILVHNAHNTLLHWHALLYPDHIWDPNYGIENIAIVPMNLLLFSISSFVRMLASTFIHLGFRGSQIAEFRADLYAAEVSGRDAMLSLLTKFHYDSIFNLAVQKFTLSQENSSLWDILTDKLENIPDSEVRRLKRLQQISGSRLDMTHPPTIHRTEVIGLNSDESSKVMLTQHSFDKIKQSLKSHFERVEKKLKDDYRSSLYY